MAELLIVRKPDAQRGKPPTTQPNDNSSQKLGSVDKFEPASRGSEVDHAEEAVGELIVTGGDGQVDFEMA